MKKHFALSSFSISEYAEDLPELALDSLYNRLQFLVAAWSSLYDYAVIDEILLDSPDFCITSSITWDGTKLTVENDRARLDVYDVLLIDSKNYGILYGFPICCIQAHVHFIAGPGYRPRLLDGTGFVPCVECNRTKTEEQLIAEITANRLVPYAFPEDGIEDLILIAHLEKCGIALPENLQKAKEQHPNYDFTQLLI